MIFIQIIEIDKETDSLHLLSQNQESFRCEC